MAGRSGQAPWNPFTRWFLLAVMIIVVSLLLDVVRQGPHAIELVRHLARLAGPVSRLFSIPS